MNQLKKKKKDHQLKDSAQRALSKDRIILRDIIVTGDTGKKSRLLRQH